jgi:hypothetical protein
MTPGLKKFHKIMKLAMNITADSDRAVNRLHIGLLDEDLFYLSI